jgi:hypothetical protein
MAPSQKALLGRERSQDNIDVTNVHSRIELKETCAIDPRSIPFYFDIEQYAGIAEKVVGLIQRCVALGKIIVCRDYDSN